MNSDYKNQENDDAQDGFESRVAATLRRRAGDIGNVAARDATGSSVAVEGTRSDLGRSRRLLVAAASIVVLAIGLLGVTQFRGDDVAETVTSVATQPSIPSGAGSDPAATADVEGEAPTVTDSAEASQSSEPPTGSCLLARPEQQDVGATDLALCDLDTDPFFHTVVPGDTLGSIAQKYNVSVDVIIRGNPDLDPNLIIGGQLLRIAGASTSSPVCPAAYPFPIDTSGDGVADMCVAQVAVPADAEPLVAAVDEVVYIPAGDWELVGYVSDVIAPAQVGAEGSQITFATGEGVFGPVVWAHFNPGVDRINYGPPGGRDTTTPAGTPVHVATNNSAASPLAIFVVEGGSVVANGYDVEEADLLTVVDSIDMVDGRLTWTGQDLPAGLDPVAVGTSKPDFGQYALRSGSEQDGTVKSLNILVMPADIWQEALSARASHPDAVDVEVAGGQGIAYPYSETTRDDPGAVYVLDGNMYILRLGRWSPSDPFASTDEVIAVLDQVAPVAVDDVLDKLGLALRNDLYSEWLREIPLPPGADVSWLLTGSATTVRREAFYAHQVFRCYWAQEWVETGDPLALEQITKSETWPTAQALIDIAAADGEQAELPPGPTIENRNATTRDERSTNALQADCGFVLGPLND